MLHHQLTPPCQISPHWCRDGVWGQISAKFYHISEYKCHKHIPLDSLKILKDQIGVVMHGRVSECTLITVKFSTKENLTKC